MDFSLVDRVINHLKLTFVADKPRAPHIAQELLMAAEAGGEYFSWPSLSPGGEVYRILGAFIIFLDFLAHLALFYAQLDIPTYHGLSSITMG